MLREYAITLHITMQEYDAQQGMHYLTDALRRIAESHADDDHHDVTVRVEAGATLDEEAAALTEYHCALCGQHITDGKPCGCGARHA